MSAVARFARDVERGLAPVIAQTDVGPVLNQQAHGIAPAIAGSPHQGGELMTVALIHVNAGLEQHADDFIIARTGCVHHRRLEYPVLGIEARTAINQ